VRLLPFLLITGLLISSCSTSPSLDEVKVEDPTPIPASTPIPCPTPSKKSQTGTGSITFKGVSLQTYIPEAQTIEAVLVPPVCLEHETDKPDGIAPQHVSLKLDTLEAFHQRRTFYDPEIVIFPIADFRIVLANSEDGFEYIQKQMDNVWRILKQQPSIPKGLPEPQIYDDGSRTIYTHVKYASFNGLTGVFYLTHFDIEPSLIGNDRLIYVFQGLSDDGKYYVSATLPVMLDWLPDYDADSFDGYTLPGDYHSNPKKQAQYYKELERYINRMQKRLEATPPERFKPSLTSIEETVRSLKINEAP
jgi:hypothetical protein